MPKVPLPTAILKTRGSWVAKTRPHEPTAPSGRPPTPPTLEGYALEVWTKILDILEPMRVLTVVDGQALERYALLSQQWRQANQFLSEHGQAYAVSTGKKVTGFRPYPQVSLLLRLSQELLVIEREYGLTPSSRTRIHQLPEKDYDKASKGSLLKMA